MLRTNMVKGISVLAASLVVTVVGVLAVASVSGPVAAATANRRPVCNSLGFNLPTTVGTKVVIPVTDVAADPDLTPVHLVSVFNGGSAIGTVSISDNGTPTIFNDDVLVFTLTSTTPGTVVLYWTVSDGSLSAQCQSYASNVPPPDNG
jgi:hypothetical protein